jgi:hypothetical protein
MTGPAPTRVVLYSIASGTKQPVAEFRWRPDADVTLTILDPDQAGTAQYYYDLGAPFNAERRSVHRSEGATFMRALVQPARSTYRWFADESDTDSATGQTGQ